MHVHLHVASSKCPIIVGAWSMVAMFQLCIYNRLGWSCSIELYIQYAVLMLATEFNVLYYIAIYIIQ